MWDAIHKVFTEITTTFSGVILAVIHGPESYLKIKRFFGFVEEIERHGDRRMPERWKIMDIKEIFQDAELAKQVLPEFEAWWSATQALIQKVEQVKAAQALAEGGPPT